MSIAALLALVSLAPQPADPVAAARSWRRQHEHAIVEEFVELLSIPNHGRNPPAIRRNADWIAAAMRRRGVEPRMLEVRYAPPVVFGRPWPVLFINRIAATRLSSQHFRTPSPCGSGTTESRPRGLGSLRSVPPYGRVEVE